jgi:hypothetical protein
MTDTEIKVLNQVVLFLKLLVVAVGLIIVSFLIHITIVHSAEPNKAVMTVLAKGHLGI